MGKKRLPPSNGQAKGSGLSPVKTRALPKSKNVKQKTNPAKTGLVLLTLFLLILSVIILKYPKVVSFIYNLENVNVTLSKDDAEDGSPWVTDGGWRLANDLTKSLYDSSICTIDRLNANEITFSEFEKNYRFQKPLIVKFPHGAKDWTEPGKWTVDSLSQEYGDWSVLSGNGREIVRRGGSGYVDSSFSKYVKEMIRSNDSLGEPLYVFDREFYRDSSLPRTLHLPSYLAVRDDLDDSIFFLGSSRSGVSFHKHADAWNGVVYGRKRWFLYPVHQTPPGGVYPGYTQTEWFEKIYPGLTGKNKPMECIQEPGEIFYLPEGTYHGTINLGDTIAIGIQKKEAQTEVEKLFYEENKLVGRLRSETDVQKKNKLLKRKKEIYISLLNLIPDNGEVLLRAGLMYQELGDMDKALSYTKRAIQQDPNFIVAIISLGELHEQLRHLDEAERLYKQAMLMNPKLWDCYARYGDFLLNNKRASEAVQIFLQGVILEPKMKPFWNRLKLAQERSGDIEGARETESKMSELKLK